jgi:uncharacterized membrane protein
MKTKTFLIALFVSIAILWNALDLFDYFGWGFRNELAAMYGYFGKQSIKLGFDLPIWCVQNDVSHYYIHHPPLVYWIISLFFYVLGIHEWCVRLVGLIFCAAWMSLLCYMIANIWSKRHALVASILLAVMPLSTFYGSIVPESTNLFWILANVWCYYCFQKTKENRYWVGLALTLILGGLCDYEIFYLTPLYFIHSLLKDRNRAILIWYPLISLAMIAIWFYIVFAIIGQTGETQYSRFYLFAIPPLFRWLSAISSHMNRLVSAPLLFLAVYGLFHIKKHLWIATILGVYGLIHLLVFRIHALNHDFFIIHLLPFVVVTASFGANSFFDLIKKKPVLKAVFVVFVVSFSAYLWRENYTRYKRSATVNAYNKGAIIRASVPENENIYFVGMKHAVLYYSDRSIDIEKYMKSFDYLRKIAAEKNDIHILFQNDDL